MANEIHLKVFIDKSVFVKENEEEIFYEGPSSKAALDRYKGIKERFEEGFLENEINDCLEHSYGNFDELPEKYQVLIASLVDSVTSEVGRALVGLSCLQLAVKSVDKYQNIRLHKSSRSKSAFSWQEGISMRVLDKNYVTPVLRKYDLMRLNADGFMMTRSLAENYPYTPLYKANLRGARLEWLNIVEGLENDEFVPIQGLKYLIVQLLNKSTEFRASTENAIKHMNALLEAGSIDVESVLNIFKEHMQVSDYAARLMEIGMHSFMQAIEETDYFGSKEVTKLSQMRSANKKHGNIGDIELAEDGEIYESWDAKYGKSYLRDEIEELAEKLSHHEHVDVAGFVTTEEPIRMDELRNRIEDIQDAWDVKIIIQNLDSWINEQSKKVIEEGYSTESGFASKWLIAYVESICQLRREKAPIDEPCSKWVQEISSILQK